MASDHLAYLLGTADDMALGKITWTAKGPWWECRASGIPFPHWAEGPTPVDALDELVRFARRVMR